MNTPEARQTIPSHIGHYEILSIIGRGGMGLVYLARDPRLDRQIAIKCLRTELFEEHYRERFKREAMLLAKLNHPHIVQIYDFIESSEQLALVMEYVDGHNLQIQLREHLVTFAQRMQWLTQITQGLAIAHDAGIIHRDLKTENILINKRNIAKISDLGIAKSKDFNATITDHVAGSYCSMSPEQAMGEAINFKSDLFSLGILAYQLLCGAHPFGDTSNKLQVMQRIISHPPIPPTQHNPDLPAVIINLLGQLLAKNPDSRPDNTHWVAAQFEKLSQLLPTTGFTNDDTQALIQGAENPSNPSGMYTRSNIGINPIRNTHLHNTNEHPTFDTSYSRTGAAIIGTTQRIYTYLNTNLISTSLAGLTLVILGDLAVWQLQPKPPKYVAVIPPTLNSNGMPESQQDLMKGAVYDAIQQSVIQLDGFYLIPHTEIADINGDIEMIRQATAADEIITTDIKCEVEACTIILSRLTPERATPLSRLRVQDTKTTDVLIDNYLSVAETIQSNVGSLYFKKISNTLEKINEDDYAKFLTINLQYRATGESRELIDKLDSLSEKTKILPAVQTLYCEIALDLYHETKEMLYLRKTENFIALANDDNLTLSHLINIFQLRIAEGNFSEATQILEKISAINASSSFINQLQAYLKMGQKEYGAAISYYKKSLLSKKTTDTLYEIAIAYLYSGDTENAKLYINKALELSPNFYNALSLYGAITLVEGDVKNAIRTLEKIHQKTPDDTVNLANLGFAYLLNKEYEKALNLFTHASTITPHNTTILLNMADTEYLLGNINEANKIYQQIIDFQDDQQKTNETLRNTAQAYAHLHKYSDALSLLKELEKLDPQNIETLYAIALVHTIAKNNSMATLYVRNAMKNGMNKIWFGFPWFDALCTQEEFVKLMIDNGAPTRCAPLNMH